MDLPTLVNAPRAVYLGDRRYWVRPLTLDGLGTILGWLDDTLPGRDDRKTPPRISDPASQEALQSGPGAALLAWLALRSTEPDITEETAAELARGADDVERARLIHVLLGRRRTYTPGAGGTDIAEIWWGPLLCEFPRERSAGGLLHVYPSLTLEAIGRLTLDQLDCLMSGGCDDEDPSLASQEFLQQLHEQALANAAAKATANGESH
jgi:hypothetical protein